MDSHALHRGPLSGEVGSAVHTRCGTCYYPYAVRNDITGEVVLDGYAGDLQEAVQSVDLYLDYLLNRIALT